MLIASIQCREKDEEKQNYNQDVNWEACGSLGLVTLWLHISDTCMYSCPQMRTHKWRHTCPKFSTKIYLNECSINE